MSVVDLQQIESNSPKQEETEKPSRLSQLLKRDRTNGCNTSLDPTTDFYEEEDSYLPNTYRVTSPQGHPASCPAVVMSSKEEQNLNAIATAAAAGSKAGLPVMTATEDESRSVAPSSPKRTNSTSLSGSESGSPQKKSNVSMSVYNQSPKRVSAVASNATQGELPDDIKNEEGMVETESETSSSEGEEDFVDARVMQEVTNVDYSNVPLHIEAKNRRGLSLEKEESLSSFLPNPTSSTRPPLVSKENQREEPIPEPVSPPKVKRGILRPSSLTSSTSSVSSSEPLKSPQPLRRQSSLLSPKSQRKQNSNRVSFADQNGGEISSHVTIDVSPNRLARRVKQRGGDKSSSPPGSPDRGNGKTSRVLVLLMDPIKKQYELTSITYSPTVPSKQKSSSSTSEEESTPIRTLLKLIPAAVSHKPLKKQIYTGFCRPTVGKEMVNLLTVEDYAIRDDEVLIAIPQGFTGSDCIVLAKPILADPRLVRLLKKLKRNEKKKNKQRLPSSAVSNDQNLRSTTSTIEKVKVIEKVDGASMNVTSWGAIAKMLSFLLVLCIFVKMAVDEEMKNRIPSVLPFEFDQFNLEQFNRDSSSLALGVWKVEEEEAKNRTNSEPMNVFLAGIKEFVNSIDGDFI